MSIVPSFYETYQRVQVDNSRYFTLSNQDKPHLLSTLNWYYFKNNFWMQDLQFIFSASKFLESIYMCSFPNLVYIGNKGITMLRP